MRAPRRRLAGVARRRRGLPDVLRPDERRGAGGARRPRAGTSAREGGRGSVIDLIDDLEAGELSIEFEGREPQELLEWALERFSPRIALSTAFQVDGVALLDMAYELDPEIRVFSVDTGRLPAETYELIEQLRERYPGLELELLSPERAPGAGDGRAARAEPLLPRRSSTGCSAATCGRCSRSRATWRRSTPGSPACAATSGRPARTSGRSRSTTTTARSSSSTRSPSGRRTRSGTTCASARSPTTRSTTAATRRSAARPAPARSPRASTAGDGRWWWEQNAPKECGIHCAVETGGLEHELRALTRRGR